MSGRYCTQAIKMDQHLPPDLKNVLTETKEKMQITVFLQRNVQAEPCFYKPGMEEQSCSINVLKQTLPPKNIALDVK